MATRSQKKKEKHKRKRREKRKRSKNRSQPISQRQPKVSGTVDRHRERLARQTPKAWDGEAVEDVAVFDDAARERVAAEFADQVDAVRESLQLALDSRGDAALERTAAISRSSPYSEWRLFIRGLVPWMAGDADAADVAWQRLDPQRRPGRIATVMRLSLHADPGGVAIKKSNGDADAAGLDAYPAAHPSGAAGNVNGESRPDDSLLYHARMLRRVRFDRAAVRIAKTGVRVSEESKNLHLGPRKIRWLKEFAAEYRQSESGLVAALEQVALGRAFAQNYSDMFEKSIKAFAGPRHDRRNLLLTFFYYSRFDNDTAAERRAERALEKYLTEDLPQNEELSEPLRCAIASQIHLYEAKSLIQPEREGFLGFMMGGPEDTKAIAHHLKESVRAYPANRDAHKAHVQWIESKLDDDRLTKPKRQPLIRQLAQVMKAWSKGLPDDVEPRLWLVDHLLETEQMKDAKPHVDWLTASRHDDPRVRATKWKWQLLEAMRLCRRKAWLSKVPARLDEAESIWPAWLSPQWLPYLRAAVMLRGGRRDEYEQQREQICGESHIARDSLGDACMMLGAAQRLRVPATDLKPLRAPVDAAVKGLSKVPAEELLSAVRFFWDLRRTRLEYPALRMHGGKIGREIYDRFSSRPGLVLDHLDEEDVQAAVLWASEYRFWGDGYQLSLPRWYSKPAVARHPMFTAAKLNGFLKLRFHWGSDDYEDLGPMLRDAAQSERDPYYRHWFVSLADALDDVLAARSSGPFGRAFGAFSEMFGDAVDEMFGEDDDDDFLDFDPDCNCPRCRAARRAYEASR